MVTINVSESTKKRFREIKLKESAKKGYSISEDEFIDYLLNLIKLKGGHYVRNEKNKG